MQQLLAAWGAPQQNQRYVIVAGTNGKGSTSLLIAEALRHSGLRVGLYTSPHLLRFTERIRIDNVEISPIQVTALYAQLCAIENRCHQTPSFFECATAMALRAFADAAVDIAVLEVGLGGRLDATNVVDKVLAVITPIDFDHQQYLGNTLTAIAGEKAAVIQPHQPVVMAPQPAEAQQVIEAVAQARQAPLIAVQPAGDVPATLPQYQHVNIATARAACRVLGCSADATERAVSAFAWPGRYQWLTTTPPMLLDGAHNPAGMQALLDALQRDPRVGQRPIHAIFTALRDKEAGPMIAMLRPYVRSLCLCAVGSARTRTPMQLQELAPDARVCTNFAHAMALMPRDDSFVLVAGSLFLVADALAWATGESRDPPVDG